MRLASDLRWAFLDGRMTAPGSRLLSLPKRRRLPAAWRPEDDLECEISSLIKDKSTGRDATNPNNNNRESTNLIMYFVMIFDDEIGDQKLNLLKFEG